MNPRRAGFTLLEMCLALLIGLMIIVLAVPSIAGLLAEQRLKKSFERFDHLAALARVRSITEQRAHRLIWDQKGISLEGSERHDNEAENTAPERLTFDKKESIQIQRPAALLKDAPPEWVFWRNGTCEPAVISYAGAAGTWVANYDGLTGRGTFVKSEVR